MSEHTIAGHVHDSFGNSRMACALPVIPSTVKTPILWLWLINPWYCEPNPGTIIHDNKMTSILTHFNKQLMEILSTLAY